MPLQQIILCDIRVEKPRSTTCSDEARCTRVTSPVSMDRHCDRFCSALSANSGVQRMGQPILLTGQTVKRLFFFFTHSASEPSNLLNRQTHITANCLIAVVSSGDLGDLPSNQTLPESDSGMFTLLSEGWAGDYSGVKDWPLRGWICSIVYSWINTHQAKKKDSLSLSG